MEQASKEFKEKVNIFKIYRDFQITQPRVGWDWSNCVPFSVLPWNSQKWEKKFQERLTIIMAFIANASWWPWLSHIMGRACSLLINVELHCNHMPVFKKRRDVRWPSSHIGQGDTSLYAGVSIWHLGYNHPQGVGCAFSHSVCHRPQQLSL